MEKYNRTIDGDRTGLEPASCISLWKTCACSHLLSYPPLWIYDDESVSRFAFLPLLCSLYAPLAPLKERCSSFVATQKHAERGLAYNCASFSRVTASTMLSATLLHLYYFVPISQRSFVTEEPSPRFGFLMVRPMADRARHIPSIWLVPLAGLAPGCQSSAVSADDLSRIKPVSWLYPSVAFDAVDFAASRHTAQGFGFDTHLLRLLFGGEIFGHRREPLVKFLRYYLSDFFCCHN